MDKRYQPQTVEPKISQMWAKGGYFTAKIDPKKRPFTIILPLPNASDPIHMGHAMFTIEDIMIRFHRMKGDPTLWLPGADHAGIETQYVFEKKLSRKGQSRFDFDRKTLYRKIWQFVEENRKLNKYQLEKLGFSLDWSRYHYSLEPKIVKKVLATFRKLYQDGLIYRAEKIVNYCPHCGTAFSNLEVNYIERDDFLYYLNYGPIKIATTRPETIFADVAVAVNPKDRKYQKLIGRKAIVPLLNKKIPIIADELVERGFGTGALKITPAHDPTDFEIGQRHHLQAISCISPEGKMINVPDKLLGLDPQTARKKTIEMLKQAHKLIRVEPLRHTVGTCYRCQNTIEPLLTPQWFIKMKPLAQPAIEAVKKGKIRFFPRRFKKVYLDWMENIRDWNISRQNVWGPRIPAWYCLDCNPEIRISFLDKNGQKVSGEYGNLKKKYSFTEIKKGLQSLTAPVGATFSIGKRQSCPKCGGKHLLQETDTFDTWFLSGQWPLNALGFNIKNPKKSSPDFKYFYPTSVLDTLWDILFFWVARMIIFGLYLAGDVPFRLVHLHAKVTDKHGQKMSKSKGNVIDPLTIAQKYGTDALRMALVFGVAPASNIALSEEKVISMRNFANKIWNASRFITMKRPTPNRISNTPSTRHQTLNKDDQEILKSLKKTVKIVTKNIEKYRFGQAAEEIYQFFWHEFCDQYIEKVKNRRDAAQPTLIKVLKTSLILLHPFMPFISEEIWTNQLGEKTPLAITKWPE